MRQPSARLTMLEIPRRKTQPITHYRGYHRPARANDPDGGRRWHARAAGLADPLRYR